MKTVSRTTAMQLCDEMAACTRSLVQTNLTVFDFLLLLLLLFERRHSIIDHSNMKLLSFM